MSAFYNDNDPVCCAVLRQLINDGVIAEGVVDARSIKEVRAADIRFRQAHFFAGAGLWSVACRLAGIADDLPIWTASVPCQPFSSAGKGGGFADDRDLWPDFIRIVREGRPPALVGEQVASAAGKGWLDRAGADLEREGYKVQCVSLPACAVDAPHIRQRLWWVGILSHADGRGRDGRQGVAQREAIGRAPAERPSAGRPISQWAEGGSIVYADRRSRRAKPGLCRMAYGMAGRSDLWRLVGNSIVPQLAAEVLTALKEEIESRSA